MTTTGIEWTDLLRSATPLTDADVEELAETQGWLVTTDGQVQDFEEFRKPFDRHTWGDGGTDQDPKLVWKRFDTAGHVYRDLDEAFRVAKRTKALRAAEERVKERKRAGYLDWDDETLWDPPTPRVVVPRIALEGQVCEIYAGGGIGKSLKSLDIVLGLTIRNEIFGEPVDPATVIYFDRENSKRGLSKRLAAMGVTRSDAKVLQNSLHYSLLGQVPSLDTAAGGEWLLSEVSKTKASCVVIDTMSKIISGEENSNDTWTSVHNQTLVGLRAAGVTVILLDHVGKDIERGPRGGSAKRDNCDVMWSLELYGSLASGEQVFELINRKDREGDFGGEGKALYLVRETDPVLRHRWATEAEVLAAKSSASATGYEYETLVRQILEENPATAFTVRAMLDAVRRKRGTASDKPIKTAFQKLKNDGLASEKGKWLGVANDDATVSPRATERRREGVACGIPLGMHTATPRSGYGVSAE